MPAITPPVIGGPIALGTQGSVLFVNPEGLFGQDNANFSYSPTDKALTLAGTPPASATKSLLSLGSALVGSDADGTFLGINAAAGYAGYLANLQHNGTSRFIVDSATGWVSCPGTGTTSERFGNGATASGLRAMALGALAIASNTNSLALGYQANSTSVNSIAFGFQAQATNSNAFAIGSASQATGSGGLAIGVSANAAHDQTTVVGGGSASTGVNSVMIGFQCTAGVVALAIGPQSSAAGEGSAVFGYQANAAHQGSMCFGRAATSTATGQLLFGGPIYSVTNAFFGKGVTHATPAAFTIQATGGSGTNIAGATLALAGGKGTGNAAGGSVTLQTSEVGASGTTLQTLRDRLVLDASGVYQLWGWTSQARQIAQLDAVWFDSTDASRKGDLVLSAVDFAATREVIRLRANGSAAAFGVFATTPATQQTVTGSRGGNAALASLLTALAAYGWIVDSTTA